MSAWNGKFLPFTTEFPVVAHTKGEFVALAITWIKGTAYSKLFESGSGGKLDQKNAVLQAENGEILKLQDYERDGAESFGLRYDNPDDAGRLWRTDLVISRQHSNSTFSILRVRTQCIALHLGAALEQPKKPYIVKSLIEGGKAGEDGFFRIGDKPVTLEDNKDGVELAIEIFEMSASEFLPVVYISRGQNEILPLSPSQIEKLAFDLGGVAHIVVEPSRDFSLRLRDAADGANVYGGSVGVYVPNAPRGKKFYIGGAIKDSRQLFSWLHDYCVSARSALPATGWDWTELQEQAFRRQREIGQNRLTASENDQLYEQEISTLKDRISELEGDIKSLSEIKSETPVGKSWDQDLFQYEINEIYPGETSDRLQYLISVALAASESQGLDSRTEAVAQSLLEQNSTSPNLEDLKARISRATKDGKKMASELTKILSDCGYVSKSDNKHLRLEPSGEVLGLESITIPKTPSDYKGLKNQRSQIENKLGIVKLSRKGL